jgi:hypothetical protein
MRMPRRTLGIVSTLLFALGAPALAQQQKAKPAAEAPGLPKPTAEHEMLKQDVGTWDAVVEFFPAPGAPAVASKAVETSRLGPGGLWVVTDFKGEFAGAPFEGHGTTGYDAAKKKYVGTWVDSMTTGLSSTESTYDPKTRTFSGWMTGTDPAGKPVRSRETAEWRPDGTRVFTMYDKAPDGKEFVTMRITYTRRK